MMDEFQLVNDAKEGLCYVALDFNADMRRVEGRTTELLRQFVLPDFQTTMRGYVMKDEDETSADKRPSQLDGTEGPQVSGSRHHREMIIQQFDPIPCDYCSRH